MYYSVFNINFLRASYVTDEVLISGDPAMNRADKVPSLIEEKEGQEAHKSTNKPENSWRPGALDRDFS